MVADLAFLKIQLTFVNYPLSKANELPASQISSNKTVLTKYEKGAQKYQAPLFNIIKFDF